MKDPFLIKMEQSLMIDRLVSRWEMLWNEHSEMHEQMLRIENRFPVSGIELIDVMPYRNQTCGTLTSVGSNRAGMRDFFTEFLDRYFMIKETRPTAQIGCNSDGFFIFCQVDNAVK